MKIFLNLCVYSIAFFWVVTCKSQSFLNAGAFQIGGGSSSLLGDLGGSKGKGSNFIKDLDAESVRFSLNMAADWTWSNQIEYRANISFIFLNADDKYSGESSRRMRNLSVNTSIYEITPTLKYNFFKGGNTLKKWTKNESTNIYLTMGTGIIFFNPGAQYNNRNYNLKHLTTEGQGLSGGAKNYSRVSVVIPIGIGVRRDVNSKVSVFFEFTVRKCFTDYLDDVSTTYYNNASLAALNGEDAAALADRNTSGFVQPQGVKRGNPGKNDSYFTMSFGYRKALNFFGKRLI
ncbi:MAG: DUF6089 family protein [Bacteroidia bacterium]